MREPDLRSKVISIIYIVIFCCLIVLASYLPSILDSHVNSSIFTISQSLAFGSKPAIIILLTICILLLIYLIYYRDHKKYVLFRVILLLIIYSLFITIIWITTFYNITTHYILAIIIFISLILYICITSLVIFNGLKLNSISLITKIILYGIPILSILGGIGLFISTLDIVSNTIHELFPSFENYIIVIHLFSILSLGFI